MRDIEAKWLAKWQEAKVFEADPKPGKKKFFVTSPYPYVNGPPHLGHAYTFTRNDTMARFRRMQGYNVLFPFAFHATGEPIAGVAERLKSGDEKQRKILIDAGVPPSEVEKFTEPKYIVSYWMKRWIEIITEIGGSIDWRRKFVTTTLTPQYSKFIEWQYKTLKKKGYVAQGTHPVIWCPRDKSPTGDHDRLEGEGVSPEEYILIKFRLDDGSILPAATFRPETTFGVTNMWLNPEAIYAKAKVDGETWIVSHTCVPKLGEQLRKVEILEEFAGKKLIGKMCRNPVTGAGIPILPAPFVDPKSATGVVMSVPAHAPYDWIALQDLASNPEECEKYGLDKNEIAAIKPVSLIKAEGFGEFPAVEACKQLGITSQQDKEKLEKATSMVYKKEFHTGALKENTAEYSGMKVSECKQRIVSDFSSKNLATTMQDTAEKVVCRCGTDCIVKILENQWFLKFSDEGWKDAVKDCITEMKFYPGAVKSQFDHTVDWLKDKACTRKTGLGTPLPWDRSWIVETLSDSVIYMAYYTISKFINELGIPAQKFTDEVFDYIFLEEGDCSDVAKKAGLDVELLDGMKAEFNYWYPVDLRGSGKDLVQNHLVFYIFHHTAIFPRELWPRAIAVNGYVTVGGEKMSKSKGNFITLRRALSEFGSDATRFALMYSAEGMEDPDWKPEEVKSHLQKLDSFLNFVRELPTEGADDAHLDKWLRSRMARHVMDCTAALEEVRTRSALQAGWFDALSDVKWYMKRGGRNAGLLKGAASQITRMISPTAPYTAEEAWHALGNPNFASVSEWPVATDGHLEPAAELGEELIAKTLKDIEEVIKLVSSKTGKKPSRIFLYTAPEWKFVMLGKMLELKGKTLKEVLPALMKDAELREHGKDVSALAPRVMGRMPDKLLARDAEFSMLDAASPFFSGEFGLDVKVLPAEGQTVAKASQALPMKPAIYAE